MDDLTRAPKAKGRSNLSVPARIHRLTPRALQLESSRVVARPLSSRGRRNRSSCRIGAPCRIGADAATHRVQNLRARLWSPVSALVAADASIASVGAQTRFQNDQTTRQEQVPKENEPLHWREPASMEGHPISITPMCCKGFHGNSLSLRLHCGLILHFQLLHRWAGRLPGGTRFVCGCVPCWGRAQVWRPRNS